MNTAYTPWASAWVSVRSVIVNTALYNVGQRLRKRHLDNPALKLWWDLYYQNMPVQTQKGPLIENYLKKLLFVMNQARQDCNRIFAIRIDLHYPDGTHAGLIAAQNATLSAFLEYLHQELDVAGTKYPHKLRNAWCCEQETSVNPHYHLLLLLNGNAYNGYMYIDKTPRGDYEYDNLFHRIVRAWSRAINCPQENMEGLVQLPRKPITKEFAKWHFRSDDHKVFADVFHAASYLCKAYTKPIGQGVHCFDGSRH